MEVWIEKPDVLIARDEYEKLFRAFEVQTAIINSIKSDVNTRSELEKLSFKVASSNLDILAPKMEEIRDRIGDVRGKHLISVFLSDDEQHFYNMYRLTYGEMAKCKMVGMSHEDVSSEIYHGGTKEEVVSKAEKLYYALRINKDVLRFKED